MRLSDTIEHFIKAMLQEDQMEVELKRNELAEYFHCAPSQINYVLATRFTPDHGYMTSSQRGGGGYIRIVRVRQSSGEHLSYLLRERIGESLDAQTAQVLCAQLAERKVVTLAQARTMAAAVSPQALSVPVPEAVKDVLRAKILKNMLLTIMQQRQEEEG
ncbi:MAG: CtsR family transcriptional regulator [Clostridiales bacterium]|nr:CtsR family transcriptional regulator [Clostridiales bacterium]